MRNPEVILNTLCSHSSDKGYRYERIYRILFNEEMFMLAYEKIKSKPGNMTPGTDGKTIDGTTLLRIGKLIGNLKNESYQPKPAKRVYIPKKNGKKRPLGIPSFEDKLVQEVVRMILEAIYEGHFEDTSHGFRPRRSCHTALTSIQKTFTGVKWFVEGDIKGFFDNINHNTLLSILNERIADECFLRLIRKFLNAGYIEDWKFINTYSGTPQGGIISPILANIYLDKFDKYMNEYAKRFNKGEQRVRNNAYFRLNTQAVLTRKKLKAEMDDAKRQEIAEKAKALQDELRKTSCSLEIDDTYRRIKYVRYADDFLIGVIGSKADCEKIKQDITEFMQTRLNLELSAEKTLITNAKEIAKFLGFDITVRTSSAMKRNKKGVLQRDFNRRIELRLPMETVKKKLKDYDVIQFVQEKGHEVWKPKSRPKLVNKRPEEILAQFNWEIRGFYNYYSIANNVSATCSQFGYIMEYSFYLTLAHKLRSSIAKLKGKYYKDKNFTIPYKDEKGKVHYRILYNGGFKRKTYKETVCHDIPPYTVLVPHHTLIERLMENHCELCGKDAPTVMHHVRNLNKLPKDSECNILMKKLHRKTLAVCSECVAKILEQESRIKE